jgi:hypothetical protein
MNILSDENSQKQNDQVTYQRIEIYLLEVWFQDPMRPVPLEAVQFGEGMARMNSLVYLRTLLCS